jgi:hypothetical protein
VVSLHDNVIFPPLYLSLLQFTLRSPLHFFLRVVPCLPYDVLFSVIIISMPSGLMITASTHEASTAKITIPNKMPRLVTQFAGFLLTTMPDRKREATNPYETRNRFFNIFQQDTSNTSFHVFVEVVYLSSNIGGRTKLH